MPTKFFSAEDKGICKPYNYQKLSSQRLSKIFCYNTSLQDPQQTLQIFNQTSHTFNVGSPSTRSFSTPIDSSKDFQRALTSFIFPRKPRGCQGRLSCISKCRARDPSIFPKPIPPNPSSKLLFFLFRCQSTMPAMSLQLLI